MIDAHCHLNFHAFENDYDDVIKRALDAGVHTIINTGTQISSSTWAVELAEKYDNLYAVVGIHPHHADKLNVIARSESRLNRENTTKQSISNEIASPSVRNDEKDWLSELENLARHPKVIGIGECGMDFHNYPSNGIVDPQIQKEIFIKQIELAGKLNLPLQVHSRNEEARKVTIDILKAHKHHLQDVPGMFHCMAGSIESLKQALALGFYVGFDGNSMYKGLPPDEPLELAELIDYAPLDRIVIETDSPYLTPLPHRGQRNEPAYAILIAKYLADRKHISLEKVIEQTDNNVYTIFDKLKR